MFTLACEQVLNFLGKKISVNVSANQNAHTTVFTCEKYRTTNQNARTIFFACKKYAVKYEFYFGLILHVNLYTHIINIHTVEVGQGKQCEV